MACVYISTRYLISMNTECEYGLYIYANLEKTCLSKGGEVHAWLNGVIDKHVPFPFFRQAILRLHFISRQLFRLDLGLRLPLCCGHNGT